MIAGLFVEYSIQFGIIFLIVFSLIGGLSTVKYIIHIPSEVENNEQKQIAYNN